MNKLLFLLLFCATTVYGGITRVQTAVNSTGITPAGTLTLTFGSPTTVGNFVVVGVAASSLAVQAAALTDAGYTVLGSLRHAENATGPEEVFVVVAKVITAGTTVTIDTAGTTSAMMLGVAAEYSGTNITLDKGPATATGNTTAPATGSQTQSDNASLLIGVVSKRCQQATAPNTSWCNTPTNGFSIVGQTTTFNNTANGDRAFAMLDQITTTNPGAITGAVTSTYAANQWAGAQYSFYEILSSSVSSD
jgi:hypothetical protein